MKKMNKLTSLLTLFAASSCRGFGPSAKPPAAVRRCRTRSSLSSPSSSSSTLLPALIYGWDNCPAEEVDSTPMKSPMDSYGFGLDEMECSPAGTAVAQALSYDPDRAGHLARLAVAFSPPERALTLDQLEQVNVICVRDNAVDIAAVICEDGTCLTLSVPVRFPRDCGGDYDLQSCVLSNLEDLNAQAATVLTSNSQRQQQEQQWSASATYQDPMLNVPAWWVYAQDPDMVEDCQTIQRLLNEEEFQPDVKALAQDVVSEQTSNKYRVVQAKVVQVGPAGLCLHVRATVQGVRHLLDVAYPFTVPATTPDELRAAVLGAVAAAEGE